MEQQSKEQVVDAPASAGKALGHGRRADVASRHVAGIDAIIGSYHGDRDELEAISREELAERLERGGMVVLDVRPPAEFAAGHLPGAVSAPSAERTGA